VTDIAAIKARPDIAAIKARLFGAEPVVSGPPCPCHQCRGLPVPQSREAEGRDRAAHAEWYARFKRATGAP